MNFTMDYYSVKDNMAKHTTTNRLIGRSRLIYLLHDTNTYKL